MTSVVIWKCSFYDQARAAFVYFSPWSKCNKFNADRKRTFGPVRHCGAFPGIAMASTNTQDTYVKALSLQDALCLVSFDV